MADLASGPSWRWPLPSERMYALGLSLANWLWGQQSALKKTLSQMSPGWA